MSEKGKARRTTSKAQRTAGGVRKVAAKPGPRISARAQFLLREAHISPSSKKIVDAVLADL
jgi:hypothetical protein